MTPEQRIELLEISDKCNEMASFVLELSLNEKIGKEQGVEVAGRLMAIQNYIHGQVKKHQFDPVDIYVR